MPCRFGPSGDGDVPGCCPDAHAIFVIAELAKTLLLFFVSRKKRPKGETPTFIIDWPVLIFLGLLFGYGVKGTPARSVMVTRAYFSGKIIVSGFVALVYYSYLLAPDWMWMYFARDSDVPRWIVFYLLVLYFFAYDAGFFLKFELSKIHPGLAKLMLAGTFLAAVAVVLPVKERYLNVGTYAEFQSGKTVPLQDSPVGKIPGIFSALLLPLGIGLLVWSRRQKF